MSTNSCLSRNQIINNIGHERVSNSEIGNFLQDQGIPQIDADIVKKCHFWMDTS